MSIKFKCNQCGRMVSAPDSAAGRQGKCTCGAVLDVPAAGSVEEVLDAEVLPSSGPNAPDEFSAIESAAHAEQYAVVDESAPPAIPAAESPAEQRRPCPMCGEMIPLAAAQCRFCGEVFNPAVAGGGAILHDPGWLTVRKGVNTIYIAIVTIFLALILMVVILAASGAAMGRSSNAIATMGLAVILPALVILGAAIAIIIGQFMCCAVPERSGARGLALGAAICMIVNILCSMIAQAVPGVQGLGGLVSMVGNILFILFIRKSALCLGNGELADSAKNFLIFAVCFWVAIFLGAILSVAAGRDAAPLVMLLGLGIIVGALVGLVWFLRLMQNMVKTIDSHRGGGFPVMPMAGGQQYAGPR